MIPGRTTPLTEAAAEACGHRSRTNEEFFPEEATRPAFVSPAGFQKLIPKFSAKPVQLTSRHLILKRVS